MHLRVAAAQLDVVGGDLEGNVRKILEALHRAEAAGADLCVFPELAVTGYPPEDLRLKSGFVADNEAALAEVAAATTDCVAVVGFVQRIGGPTTGTVADGDPAATADPETGAEARSPVWRRVPMRLANAAAVCAGGRVAGVYHKQLLPNYSVFDERRWFSPGHEPPVLYRVGAALMGVSICEDVWADDGPV